jgi:hypothetical protein
LNIYKCDDACKNSEYNATLRAAAFVRTLLSKDFLLRDYR